MNSTLLRNGQRVREGDLLCFQNSDGYLVIDKVERRKDGTLYFFSSDYDVIDYEDACKLETLVPLWVMEVVND